MSYDESYFVTREHWRDWRIEAGELIRLAKVKRGERVLEIGCGGGGLLRRLHDRGARVVGIDTLRTALDLAHRQSNARERGQRRISRRIAAQPEENRIRLVLVGANGSLPFRNNSFDAVLGQHVIEHLPDADQALKEWHRILKPNGRLALATPNALHPDPTHFEDVDHTHVFVSRELRDAVARTGFSVESCYAIFSFTRRVRLLGALGVIGYNLFRRLPYWSERGRTILLMARKE